MVGNITEESINIIDAKNTILTKSALGRGGWAMEETQKSLSFRAQSPEIVLMCCSKADGNVGSSESRQCAEGVQMRGSLAWVSWSKPGEEALPPKVS